jgi:hypothetical protein
MVVKISDRCYDKSSHTKWRDEWSASGSGPFKNRERASSIH